MANPHSRTVALLNSHRTRVARALVRQIRTLSPRYATVEPSALEMSLQRTIMVVSRYLETGDDKALKATTMNTAQLRQALGFRVDDFMAAGLAFLPVVRRFIIEHASDLRTGLEDYEAFESVAIPLLAELARVFRHAGAAASHDEFADLNDDDNDDITIPNRTRQDSVVPFQIERVTGPDSDETPFS